MKPTQAATAWPEDAVEVGRIVGAWGLKGWFKVQPFASDPQALFASRVWFIRPPEVAAIGPVPTAARSSPPGRLDIEQIKDHGDVVVALAQGVGDRNGAEALHGSRIFVSRADFPKPGLDEFYWVDLIGLAVVNREGVALGSVAGLIDTGPHSVLRVVPEGESSADAERLIPFVSAYVDQVSLGDRLITVDWGLDF
jgi:16S rRNA processing protein RimM